MCEKQENHLLLPLYQFLLRQISLNLFVYLLFVYLPNILTNPNPVFRHWVAEINKQTKSTSELQ